MTTLKETVLTRRTLLSLFAMVALAVPLIAQTAKPKDIYDPKADGGKQIEVALAKATKEKKNVLLEFGANW